MFTIQWWKWGPTKRAGGRRWGCAEEEEKTRRELQQRVTLQEEDKSSTTMKVRMTAKEKETETVCQQDLCWDYIGDNNDDDDDSVELRGNNAVPPSRRDNQIVDGGHGRQLGSRDVGPRNVVDNGVPPSRDSPFVGGRGGTQLGNWNANDSGGHPPSRDYPFGSNQHGSLVGNRNVADNAVPCLRDNWRRRTHGQWQGNRPH